MKIYKYIRIVLISIPIIVLLYLFNKQFPLNGRLEIIYDFKKPNAFIGSLNPKGRLSNIKKSGGDYFQIMISDPVYFDLELPANYSKATVELKYKSENQEVIEIGGLANKDIWNFQSKPIQNIIIDGLIDEWHKIEQGDTVFLQKEEKYSSIDSFLKELPRIDEIAIFNYDLPYDYVYPDYKKSDEYLEINYQLRGKHSFYTYLGDGEDMDFSFWLYDVNEHQGSDNGQIEIYRGSKLIKKYVILDDGIVDENEKRTVLGEWKVNFSDGSGVYKVNFLLTDDILINKIRTKQKLITFTDKLNFYSQKTLESPINLFSNSSLIKVATNHTLGFQVVKIDGQELAIEDLNVEYSKYVEPTEHGYNIEIPKGNIMFSGDALFSFGEEHFFDPRVKILDKEDKLSGTGYIIADYRSPTLSNGWSVGKAILDLPTFYKEKNKIRLMISAPNLDKNRGEIKISEIKIMLEAKPFILKVFDHLLRLIKYF
jgi:hypothetical protein